MTFIIDHFANRLDLSCVTSVFAVGNSDSYIDLNWRHIRAIILKAIEMPQFSLSEEVQLVDFTETHESKYMYSMQANNYQCTYGCTYIF